LTTDVAGARAVGMRAIHLYHAASSSQPSDDVERILTLEVLTDLLFPPES
jgi:FMN phosphatase YigB (HAD superfamily)